MAKHNIHVAVFTIEYSPGSKNLDVRVKADKNDLVDLVGVRFGYHIDLKEQNGADSNDLNQVNRFVEEQFKISGDGNNLELEIDSIKFDSEYAWLLFKTKSIEIVNHIAVKNLFMVNAFKDQKNLVIFVCGDYEKGVIFDGVTINYKFELKHN
ncbi:MAG: hypothetical protein MI922_15590 [Bacteroidales bacterium]|nr:hypothetical protein [Bacteroidales bacterium]